MVVNARDLVQVPVRLGSSNNTPTKFFLLSESYHDFLHAVRSRFHLPPADSLVFSWHSKTKGEEFSHQEGFEQYLAGRLGPGILEAVVTPYGVVVQSEKVYLRLGFHPQYELYPFLSSTPPTLDDVFNAARHRNRERLSEVEHPELHLVQNGEFTRITTETEWQVAGWPTARQAHNMGKQNGSFGAAAFHVGPLSTPSTPSPPRPLGAPQRQDTLPPAYPSSPTSSNSTFHVIPEGLLPPGMVARA